jgi:uncharacterized YccA/Bax inhibitor family protein
MSNTMNTAFKRIGTEYGSGQQVGGGWAPTHAFKASRAYDKLIGLSIVVLVSAIAGWAFVPAGVAVVAMFVAFGVVLVSWFKMALAKYLAPVYAVLEGIALGAISGSFATLGGGIIPMAVVFTAAVFVGCLVLYRTGLIRVTPRFARIAGVGAFGVVAVSILSLFIGIPGVNTFGPLGVVFGVLCLGVAVFNLLTDFDFVQRAEMMGISADAEWSAALAMLTAMVLVYISMLRIIASMYGGRRA